MSAKQTLPGQHVMLEKAWPGDCCLCTHEATIADLRAENARLQEQVKETDEVMGLAIEALNERVREVDLLKRERDDYKALAERHWRALHKWRMGGGHLHGAVVDTDKCPACLEFAAAIEEEEK